MRASCPSLSLFLSGEQQGELYEDGLKDRQVAERREEGSREGRTASRREQRTNAYSLFLSPPLHFLTPHHHSSLVTALPRFARSLGDSL